MICSFIFMDAAVVLQLTVCSEQDANVIAFLVKQQFGFPPLWHWTSLKENKKEKKKMNEDTAHMDR